VLAAVPDALNEVLDPEADPVLLALPLL